MPLCLGCVYLLGLIVPYQVRAYFSQLSSPPVLGAGKKITLLCCGVQYVCIVCFLSGHLGKIFKLSLCKIVRQRTGQIAHFRYVCAL